MQLLYVAALILFGLMGCASSVGIGTDIKPYNAVDLSQPHAYLLPAATLLNDNKMAWWGRFNDPQLNQFIELALADSPNINIAQSRVKKAQYLAQETRSKLFPSLGLTGYLQRQKFPFSGLVPPPFNGKTFNIADLALNFNYEFDFWGKNRQLLAVAISEELATQAELAEARQVLSTAVASVYFQIQVSFAQLHIAKQTLKLQQEYLNIINARTQRGIDTAIPVKNILAQIQSAKIMVLQRKQSIELLSNQLIALFGKNPLDTKIDLPPFSFKPQQVALPASIPANLLAHRPDIIAARLRVEAAAHQINVAKTRFFPNINLIGLFSYQSIILHTLFETRNQDDAIEGAIDLPIFDAGARRANLSAKYIEYDIAVNQYNQTILTGLREVADKLFLFKSLDLQRVEQDNSLTVTRQNYHLTNARYQQGITDYVPVIDIQTTLLQQESRELDIQEQHLQAMIGLIKALGAAIAVPAEEFDR